MSVSIGDLVRPRSTPLLGVVRFIDGARCCVAFVRCNTRRWYQIDHVEVVSSLAEALHHAGAR